MHRRRFLLVSGGLVGSLAGCSGDERGDVSPSPTGTREATPVPTATPTEAPTATEPPSLTTPDPRLFTGEERAFVVNGYSTSFDWPAILQRKLDRYFDGDRVITVHSALEPGTPIVQWIDPDTGERLGPWKETLAPALDRTVPVVALAQQSLQGLWGNFPEGIRGEDDAERIEGGADLLELYTDRLLADGADHVFVATHIYKKPLEPVIGNERLALAAFLERDPEGVTAGPDVWEPTKDHWPGAFQDDKLHPNQVGAEIMAHHWFRRLLVADDREVPDWSRTEMDEAIDEGA